MVNDQLAASSKLAFLPWLQVYHDNKENRRACSDSLMDVYTDCHLYGTRNCWLYILEKFHHFTLTESLVIKQKEITSEFKLENEMNGRCRHLEQKIWFLTINQVQPNLFLWLVVIWVKGELVTEMNENNDFTTMIQIWDLFCALLNIYISHRGQLNYLLMF